MRSSIRKLILLIILGLSSCGIGNEVIKGELKIKDDLAQIRIEINKADLELFKKGIINIHLYDGMSNIDNELIGYRLMEWENVSLEVESNTLFFDIPILASSLRSNSLTLEMRVAYKNFQIEFKKVGTDDTEWILVKVIESEIL